MFATSRGTTFEASNVVNRNSKPLLKRAAFSPIRWHDLRHTCFDLHLRLVTRRLPVRGHHQRSGVPAREESQDWAAVGEASEVFGNQVSFVKSLDLGLELVQCAGQMDRHERRAGEKDLR